MELALLLALSLGAADADAPEVPMQLKPCPSTPNCVSTQAVDSSKRMDPIAFAGSPAEAHATLLRVLDQPRVAVAESTATYIHAVFTTRIMKYRDDVEFVIDPDARLVHFRSASRVGTSDLGTNRRRMKGLVKRFKSTHHE
jgi:uncharacterized protein (DUF1499 family)